MNRKELREPGNRKRRSKKEDEIRYHIDRCSNARKPHCAIFGNNGHRQTSRAIRLMVLDRVKTGRLEGVYKVLLILQVGKTYKKKILKEKTV